MTVAPTPAPLSFALTKAEERVLAPKAKRHVERKSGSPVNSDNHEAAERLVRSAHGMIAKMAHKWADKTGCPVEDLLQEGLMAAPVCLSKLAPTKGLKFVTYASNSAWRGMERWVEGQSRFAKEYAVSPNMSSGYAGHSILKPLDEMTPKDDAPPKEDVEPFLKVLAGTEFDFPVRAYYGIGMAAMNTREIGELVGVTKNCISFRLAKGLEAIREG